MKLYFAIPASLRLYYEQELLAYDLHMKQGQVVAAWIHLERAHILGQAYPWEHTRAHWKMLAFGFKTKNAREVLGQVPRLLVGGIKSWAGIIPVGNTGGANVSPVKPMPIPADLLQVLQTHGGTRDNEYKK